MYYAYFDKKGELKAIAETTEKLGEAVGVTGACVSYHLHRNNPQYAAYETKKDLNQGVREHMNMPEIPDKSSRVFAKFLPNGHIEAWGNTKTALSKRLGISLGTVCQHYRSHKQGYFDFNSEQEMKDYSRTLIKRAKMARKKEDVIPLSESEKAMEFYKRPAYAGTMLCMDSAWRPGTPEYERRRRKEA
jgi:hypothetical protein